MTLSRRLILHSPDSSLFVGWVERSETQHHARCLAMLGLAALDPTYGVSQANAWMRHCHHPGRTRGAVLSRNWCSRAIDSGLRVYSATMRSKNRPSSYDMSCRRGRLLVMAKLLSGAFLQIFAASSLAFAIAWPFGTAYCTMP